jgi:hypothetical protein
MRGRRIVANRRLKLGVVPIALALPGAIADAAAEDGRLLVAATPAVTETHHPVVSRASLEAVR